MLRGRFEPGSSDIQSWHATTEIRRPPDLKSFGSFLLGSSQIQEFEHCTSKNNTLNILELKLKHKSIIKCLKYNVDYFLEYIKKCHKKKTSKEHSLSNILSYLKHSFSETTAV